jgi:hypothetical protein
MKTKLTILILLLWAGNCWAAELLVRAKPHWMDSFTQVEVDKLSPGDKQSYEARSQIGDIVVVRPDNWVWGKEECLPNFIVVKVPGMNEVEAKQYEQSLMEQKGIDERGMPIMVMLRHRKYALPKTDITVIKTNTVTFSKTSLIANTITKTGLASEISAPINSPIAYLWRRITKKVNPYLNIAWNYWVKKCFAAEFLKKTVMPSGGDYTSLEACMNANEQDLTGDGWFTVEIDGTWSSADTTAVTIHNYTTTVNDYINIYTASAARHKGVYSTSYYLLYPSTDVIPLTVTNNIDTSKCTINGLQVDGRNKTGTGGEGNGGLIYFTQYQANTTVCNCLVRSKSYSGIDVQQGRGSYTRIYNNIIYDTDRTAYSNAISHDGANSPFIANNTTYGFYRAFHRYGTGLYNNLVMYAANVALYQVTAGTGSNNATYDATGDDPDLTAGIINKTSYSDYFVSTTAGSEDFHLKSTATDFIGAGTDLSGTFTTDIDGVTRSGTWDIGADEYVAAGGAVDDSQVFVL